MAERTGRFQSIGALLGNRAPQSEQSSASEWVEEYGCDYCHDAGFIRGPLKETHPGRFEAKAIPCQRCRPGGNVALGIPQGLTGKTFADFNLGLNPGMKKAYELAKRVASGEQWCALLMGDPGLGKSLLACCALAERGGYFWEWGALLRNIRHLAFGDGGPKLPEEDVLGVWQNYSGLLVLDDVGAEKMTEWAAQTLYAICNARYQAELPTILTTNNPDAIDDRILSRYAVGSVVCEGRDVRRMGGQ